MTHALLRSDLFSAHGSSGGLFAQKEPEGEGREKEEKEKEVV